ncbi:MAG: ABC transporter permease [Planctomycetota bacterium]
MIRPAANSLLRRLARRAGGFVSRHAQNVGTALVQVWANKGRSILTTLGIIIAVTSTITVVALVQGFGNHMTKMVRGYGTQFMVVHPWDPSVRDRHGIGRVSMTIDDIEAVRTECQHVRRITPFVFTENAEIAYGPEKAKDIPCRGVTEEYQIIRNFPVDTGRFFGPIDVENAAPVIVLGRSLLKHLQCDESIVGRYVFLDGERFLVVGLLQPKGSMFGEDQDETVMIPYSVAVKLYPNLRRSIPFLVEASSEQDLEQAQGEIARVLRRRHALKAGQPDDFRIDRQDQAVREFENIRNIASGVLAGIVSISLLVGGIGIMNIMLVSVTERTREIGLRKSIGGRRRDIMMQFLTEAVVLCTLGGAVGVVLGYALCYLAALHPQMVEISVPAWAVALALVSSAGAGVVFGIIPAFKAAILHPIEALRHE